MNVRRATAADASAVASIHRDAFSGQLSALVGTHYAEALVKWFATQPTALALVAEEDGELAGYVFGAPDGYSVKMNRQLAPWIVLGVARHLPAIALHPSFKRQLTSRLSNIVLGREAANVFSRATPTGTICLVGIGTAPRSRGRGVGGQLVEEFCRLFQPRPVILDVLNANAPARSLYRKLGFRDLVKGPEVTRMIRNGSAPQ